MSCLSSFQALSSFQHSSIRACLILRGFALSRRGLARLRRANNLLCCVENALRAFSTQHNKTDERRRREQAIVMEIRQTLTKVGTIGGEDHTTALQVPGMY